jgi:hypothetical protein
MAVRGGLEVFWPNSRPLASAATTVWVDLCESLPMVTIGIVSVNEVTGPVGGHAWVGAVPRSYQVTPADPIMSGGRHIFRKRRP